MPSPSNRRMYKGWNQCVFRHPGKEEARRIERLAHGHVHVEVTIRPEPPDKGDRRLALGALDILGQLFLVLHQPDWIVGDIAVDAFAREFAVADRALVLLPG